MQEITAIRNYLNFMREIISFVKKSPKRVNTFNLVQSEFEPTDFNPKTLRPFCLTRWCMRISSLKTINNNYEILISFFENVSCNEKNVIGEKANVF